MTLRFQPTIAKSRQIGARTSARTSAWITFWGMSIKGWCLAGKNCTNPWIRSWRINIHVDMFWMLKAVFFFSSSKARFAKRFHWTGAVVGNPCSCWVSFGGPLLRVPAALCILPAGQRPDRGVVQRSHPQGPVPAAELKQSMQKANGELANCQEKKPQPSSADIVRLGAPWCLAVFGALIVNPQPFWNSEDSEDSDDQRPDSTQQVLMPGPSNLRWSLPKMWTSFATFGVPHFSKTDNCGSIFSSSEASPKMTCHLQCPVTPWELSLNGCHSLSMFDSF